MRVGPTGGLRARREEQAEGEEQRFTNTKHASEDTEQENIKMLTKLCDKKLKI